MTEFSNLKIIQKELGLKWLKTRNPLSILWKGVQSNKLTQLSEVYHIILRGNFILEVIPKRFFKAFKFCFASFGCVFYHYPKKIQPVFRCENLISTFLLFWIRFPKARIFIWMNAWTWLKVASYFTFTKTVLTSIFCIFLNWSGLSTSSTGFWTIWPFIP